MKKFYLFQDNHSKVTHAVETKWVSLDSYELDRIFGGGLTVLCGRKAEGAGILSEKLKDPAHTTCKRCIKELSKRGININRNKKGKWPPETLRQSVRR